MVSFREKSDMIFVFGSNTAGVHGAGAARSAAYEHGAIFGQGEGLQGNSYALPTKDHEIETLPLSTIRWHVDQFLCFARANPLMEFQVTRVGCGLAGYTDREIAPLFYGAPENCYMPQEWRELFDMHQEVRTYWNYVADDSKLIIPEKAWLGDSNEI
jgi:hypothetical protein